MSLADEIRSNFVLPTSFFDHITELLKASGRASVICDTHISEVKSYAIPYAYGKSLEDWGRKNGFSVGHSNNCYGVRHIDISI